jgi:hypothetical protein
VFDSNVFPFIFNRGFGHLRVNGRSLVPNPAASMNAFLVIILETNIKNELLVYLLP